jgi:DNA polymerase-4
MLNTLYVDLNSFFASVEQQLRPELRGQPVGVLPVLAESTCCIAASIEAKRCGVKTGTGVREARTLCPGIRFVHARPGEYVRVHHAIIAAVDSCLPVAAVHSIDEMSCELFGREREPERARRSAQCIKRAIRRQAGDWLSCSIGIAPNRYLAKLASDMQKPDGLVLLDEPDVPQALLGLKLEDFCGIGPRMAQRLQRAGIGDVAALYAASSARLRAAWGGIEGERMHALLRGRESPAAHARRASISHSHVLPPALRHWNLAQAVLYRLLHKAAVRLRHLGLLAGGLSLHVSLRDAAGWEARAQFAPHADTLSFIHALGQLWAQHPAAGLPVKVGLVLSELCPAEGQSRDLFAPAQAPALDVAVDRINQRFGPQSVYFGGAHAARQAAPMRIAFNHIPQPALEDD